MQYTFLFLSGGELVLIFLIFLLLFGSNKIPELAKGLGKGLREFKKATDDIKREINDTTGGIAKEINESTNDIRKNITDMTGDITRDLEESSKEINKNINEMNNNLNS